MFEKLMADVFQGLTGYYPELRSKTVQQSLAFRLKPKFKATGNNQADYQVLRDAVENHLYVCSGG